MSTDHAKQDHSSLPAKMSQSKENLGKDSKGLGWGLYESLLHDKDKIIEIFAPTEEKLTKEDILKTSIRVAIHMKNLGLTSSDIISICSSNNSKCAYPFIAAFLLGIKIAPMDPLLPQREILHILKLTKPKFVFCCISGAKLLESTMTETGIETKIVFFGDDGEHIPFSDFTARKHNEDEFRPARINSVHDTACIIFTSGTTGLPKGVCLSHYALERRAKQPGKSFNLLNHSRAFWISNVISLILSIFANACRVTDDFNPATFCKIVHQYKININFCTPTGAHQILQYPETNIYDISCLKYMFLVGSLVGEKLMKDLRKFFPLTIISGAYGLTETATNGTSFNPVSDLDFMKRKPTSCGFPNKGILCKIIDPETKEVLGANQSGELWIKGDACMTGYFNDPEATKAVFDSEGYLNTGDILYYDEEGCYFVVSRTKTLMKYQCWKVMPMELETIILEHPGVQEVVVVSRPHEIDGDHPTAVVIRKPGTNFTEEDIQEFMGSKVPDYKKLRGGVVFTNSLPVTPSGKYRRQEIKEMLLNGKL